MTLKKSWQNLLNGYKIIRWDFSLRSCLILLFTFISFYKGNAQGWKRKYYLSGASTASSREAFEAPNGDYVVVGTSVDTSKSQPYNALTVIGTDSAGNLKWHKTYGNSKFQYIQNNLNFRAPIVKTDSAFYHTTIIIDSSGTYGSVLIKFNYNGDTIWQRKYYSGINGENLYLQAINQSVDGGFILGGTIEDFNNHNRFGFFLKTNRFGMELWRKKINKNYPNTQDVKSLVQDSTTKKIIAVGYQYILVNNNFGVESNILFLDSLGNKLLQTSYNNFNGGPFAELIQLKDRHFLTCGTMNTYNDLGNLKRYRPTTVKFDINGNQIWTKVYDTLSPFTCMTSLHELANGDIMMGGYIDTMINYNLLGPMKMRMYKTDSNGTLKWKRYVGAAIDDQSSEHLWSMNPTKDGGYILTGRLVLGPDPRPFDVVKVDANACDSSTVYCEEKILANLNEQDKIVDQNIKIYPNPFHDVLSIEFENTPNYFVTTVIDILGRELNRTHLIENHQINLTDLKPGIYFLRIIVDKVVVLSKKIVKE